MSTLSNLSPLDGRYAEEIKELAPIFSEAGLMKYRLKVEIEYLIALSKESKIKELGQINEEDQKFLRAIYQKFDVSEAEKVKKIEKTTNHDVKAIEYFLKDKIKNVKSLKNHLEFVHFALTSEDVNNLAYSLMLKDGLAVYQKNLNQVMAVLKELAAKNKKVGLLALTHGQPASPTTLGKEMAVFWYRLSCEVNKLRSLKLTGKLSGAVGNWNAHQVAYPNVDWLAFSQKFIESLGLAFNPLTTQIESHDQSANAYHNVIRINNILKDLNQDLWLYISRGIFLQKKIQGEVGSSTMPHKINPWKFENSDGNLVMANAVLLAMADKLPISRLQRDLSDSTVIRNQGVGLGYSVLAIKSTLNGLSRLEVNKPKISEELNNHWEVLAEPIQVMLRKVGYPEPYEALKKLTRGEKISKIDIQKFIRGLRIEKSVKDQLLKLTPENYVGLAGKLVDKFIKS